MSGAWHALASAVPHRVDEQLLQHQVQFKFGVVIQGIRGAKFPHPSGQPLEFAKVSIQ